MLAFYVMALEEALARFGRPDIFNPVQGSQFSSFAFTAVLKDAEIRTSMDGRGRWMANVCNTIAVIRRHRAVVRCEASSSVEVTRFLVETSNQLAPIALIKALQPPPADAFGDKK